MTSRIAARLVRITLLALLLPVAARAERAVIRIPGETWAIAFESPALLGGQESTRDGNFAFRANSGLFNLSLFVELPQGKGETHKDCYQHYWPMASRNPMIDMASVQVRETEEYVRAQYDATAEMSGKKVRQRSVNYYIAYQGKWIDVHISFVEPGEKDASLFDTFDRTLAYGPSGGFPPADKLLNLDPAQTADRVMKYVVDGTRQFAQHDYKKAADTYGRALEIERHVPNLTDLQWKILIDNLGMAYGISGQLDKARETFEYGLSKAPRYPMFHYSLACAYAEMGKRDEAVASLRRAFEFKQNMLPGETLPDPATDDSFARFMKDKAFVNALKDMRGK